MTIDEATKGAVVKHVAPGGPRMAVEGNTPDQCVKCSYWDDSLREFKRVTLPPECLVAAPVVKPPKRKPAAPAVEG